MTIAPGTRVAARYRIEGVLGQGGMGAVYVAHDEKFGVRVALKLAQASGGQLAEFKTRFVREARVGNKLGKTAGFVRSLDWGELQGGNLYMAMDLVEGAMPLDLQSGSITERLGRLREAARLVALAHKSGVIHRDLKPANFLHGKDGTLWLADFGLAKFLGEPVPNESVDNSLTMAGVGMGTPAFMPPEQFDGAKTVDERADVYALGAMLFFALTRRMPFEGATTEIMAKQLKVSVGREPMPTARGLVPSVPEPLDELCGRAISLERAQRLESAQAFVDGLDAFLAPGGKTMPAPNLAVTVLEQPALPPAAAPATATATFPATVVARTPSRRAPVPAASSASSPKAVALMAVPLVLVVGLAVALVARSSKTPPLIAEASPTPEASPSSAPSPLPLTSGAPTPTPPAASPSLAPVASPPPLETPAPAPSPESSAAPVAPTPPPVEPSPAASVVTPPLPAASPSPEPERARSPSPSPEPEKREPTPAPKPQPSAKSHVSLGDGELPNKAAWPEGLKLASKKLKVGGKTIALYTWSNHGGPSLDLVYVPAGAFRMGDDNNKDKGNNDDKSWASPAHSHFVKGFWIGLGDVTWAQYLALCKATDRAEPERPDWWVRLQSREQHPVVNVTWADAHAFCRWANVSLPTEPQWEKAARGTDERHFPWGNLTPGSGSLRGYVNYLDRSCPPLSLNNVERPVDANDADVNNPVFKEYSVLEDGFPYTSPVGACPEGVSPYGCLDMAGNVLQWCDDFFEKFPYDRYAAGDNSPPPDPGARHPHAVRGGCWCGPLQHCQGFWRAQFPNGAAKKGKGPGLGFRVVLNAP